MAVLKDKEVLELQALAETYIHAERPTAKIKDVLGAGASAAVFDLEDGLDRLALKVYSPAFLSGDNGLAERRRLKLQESLVGHTCPSLVQLFRVTSYESTCFVEMERVAGV